MNKILKNIIDKCDRLGSSSPLNNVYGVARAILAFGLLLTLAFNSRDVLFPEHIFSLHRSGTFTEKINLFFLIGYDYIWLSKLIACILLLLVISGVYPRYTGILHWWVSFSFFNSAAIIDGGDQIAGILTFYLIPVTLLDDRRNHWNGQAQLNKIGSFSAWVIFFIIELQIAVLYLQAGIEKPYKVEEWVDGTAIYYWLNHNVFGAPDWILRWLNPLLANSLVVFITTWGIIILELTLFGAFFMTKKNKAKLLPAALLFHFLIVLFHGLVSFFFSMSGAALLYLRSKKEGIKFHLYSLKKYER